MHQGYPKAGMEHCVGVAVGVVLRQHSALVPNGPSSANCQFSFLLTVEQHAI